MRTANGRALLVNTLNAGTSVSRVAWNLGDDPWRSLGGGTDSFGVGLFGVGMSA
jgi:hypothetical protein